jgi:hypothetical protein
MLVRKLVSTHAPAIQRAFEAAIQNAKSDLDFNALVEALSNNNLGQAAELLKIRQAMLFPLEEAIRSATIAGAMSVAVPKNIRGEFSFDGRHPRAERMLARQGADLVTEIGSPGVEPIRDILLQGQKEGAGTRAVATRLRDIMGLDGPRAKRSARVREILSDPDQIADYFIGDKPRFKSTDRRYDARVRKAIREGKSLDKTTLAKITKAHDKKLLRARAKTIAEHEAFTAQAQGRNEAYTQLHESGKTESVTKKWDHATLNNPRTDHQELEGVSVPIDGVFTMGDGSTMRYPHDPNASPKHTIGCRCSVVYIPKFKRSTS